MKTKAVINGKQDVFSFSHLLHLDTVGGSLYVPPAVW